MKAAAVIRLAISSFIVVLIFVAASGWRWAGSHQSPTQAAASRVVLALCILAGLGGLAAVWRGAAGRRPRV